MRENKTLERTNYQFLSPFFLKNNQLTTQPFYTNNFGKVKEQDGLSIVIYQKALAKKMVYDIRTFLPKGFVCFIGHFHFDLPEKEAFYEVVIAPGKDQFDIIYRAKTHANNYGMGTRDIVHRLQQYDQYLGIDIYGASSDSIEFDLETMPHHAQGFAEDIGEFCPAILRHSHQLDKQADGQESLLSVDDLAACFDCSIADYVHLWWD